VHPFHQQRYCSILTFNPIYHLFSTLPRFHFLSLRARRQPLYPALYSTAPHPTSHVPRPATHTCILTYGPLDICGRASSFQHPHLVIPTRVLVDKLNNFQHHSRRHPDANQPLALAPLHESQKDLSLKVQDTSHLHTCKERTHMAKSWTELSIITRTRNQQPQDHLLSSEAASKVDHELLDPLSSRVDLCSPKPSEQSLHQLLSRPCYQQDMHPNQCLSRLRKPFSKARPHRVKQLLPFRLRPLLSSRKESQRIPSPKTRSPSSQLCSGQKMKALTPRGSQVLRTNLPQRANTRILPCRSHIQHRRLSDELMLPNVPTLSHDSNQILW
jgi:hypothetical protein